MRQAQIGFGRFGTFWAHIIKDAGPLGGWNRSPRTLPEFVKPIQLHELKDYNTIWLCNAISAMNEVCPQIAKDLSPGSCVLDTCSVKVYPSKIMCDNFNTDIEIIATHPMFGPDSARNGLAGLAMVLCPVRAKEETIRFWRDYFLNLEMRVHIMSPDEHDEAAARTQGVTHFVGRFLAELGLEDSPIATLGFKKIKEVMEQTCNDPWQLFLDLQNYNPYGQEIRKSIRNAFEKLWEKGKFSE